MFTLSVFFNFETEPCWINTLAPKLQLIITTVLTLTVVQHDIGQDSNDSNDDTSEEQDDTSEEILYFEGSDGIPGMYYLLDIPYL